MTENERIKQVRKSKNLTLEAFGERVGVTKAAISKLENGTRNVTEQVRRAVCREFGVREEWLQNGEGEMYQNPLSQQLETIYQKYELEPEDRIVIEAFLQLRPEIRKGILDGILLVSDMLRAQSEEKLKQEADEIVWQLREEKERADGSSVSHDTDSADKMA